MQATISFDLQDPEDAEKYQHASNGELYYNSMAAFARYLGDLESQKSLNKSQYQLFLKVRHSFFKCLADNGLDAEVV